MSSGVQDLGSNISSGGGGSGVSSLNSLTGALTLVAGSGITITPSGSNITIAATGGGTGTVTSVGLALPSIFAVSGSPVTTSGTLTGTFNTQTANFVFSGPASGGAATPTFRLLVAADIPDISATYVPTTRTISTTAPLAGGGALSSNLTLSIPVSTNSVDGYLSAADHTTFAAKQPAGNYITALTGDGTASGPGSVAFTLATVNASPGSFGSASTSLSATVNAKGLITSLASQSIQIAESQVTNLVSDLAAKQSTTLTNTHILVGNGSNVATDVAASGDLTLANTGAFTVAKIQGTTVSGTTGSTNVVFSAAPTLSNPVVGTQSQGDSSTKAASTAYVDVAVANAVAGVNPAVAVQAATTSAADTATYTYNNGVGGIGATLTAPSNNVALTIDGYTFTAVGQRLLVKNDTQSPSGAYNGIYSVTQIQTAILPVILTRALDYDMPSDMNNTGAIPVINGTVNSTTSWVLTSLVVTVGTTPLTFTEFTRNPADYLLKANNLSDVPSAPTSRVNLNIDQRSTFSNANYTVLSTDRYVGQTGTMSAARVATLPAANSINPGQFLWIGDESGSVTTTNLITVTAAGADTIDGSATKTIRSAYGYIRLISNGTNMWSAGIEAIGRGGTGIGTLPTNGQLLIGNSTSSNYTLAALTAGTGISVTNAAGSITLATTGAAPTGTAGGDLGGTYPNPTVVSVADVTTGVLSANNGGRFTPIVNNYTASTTMADPGPNCSLIRVRALAGGGGGGSGRKGATSTARSGGGGGSAGTYVDIQFPYSSVGSWPVTITIGAGGNGGAARATDSTAGVNGSAGGNTSFGTVVVAVGGDFGQGGQSTASNATGGAWRYGNIPGSAANTPQVPSLSGGVGGNSTVGAIGSGAGGFSGSGAGGAGATAANAVTAGQPGGQNANQAAGGAAGGVGANGGNGVAGDNSAPYIFPGGTGGGGAGSSTTAGFTGGNGALYGAGGGGGSCGTDTVNSSGAGGNGAAGFMQVIAI